MVKKSKNQDSGKSEVYNFKCSDETQIQITKSNQNTYIQLYNLIFSEPEGLEGLSMALQAVIAGGSGLSQSRGSINFDGVKCSIKIVSAEPKMTKPKMPLGFIALYDEAVEINLIYERTPRGIDGFRYAASVSPILSSLALSLASLNSIKDFPFFLSSQASLFKATINF